MASAIFQAVSVGKLDQVKSLIAAKTDVNAKGHGDAGSTLLEIATRIDHIEIVERLLHAKADPSITNIYNETPLFYAKSIEVFRLLISHGTTIDNRSIIGNRTVIEHYIFNHSKLIYTIDDLQKCYFSYYSYLMPQRVLQVHEVIRIVTQERFPRVLMTLVTDYIIAPYSHLREAISKEFLTEISSAPSVHSTKLHILGWWKDDPRQLQFLTIGGHNNVATQRIEEMIKSKDSRQERGET